MKLFKLLPVVVSVFVLSCKEELQLDEIQNELEQEGLIEDEGQKLEDFVYEPINTGFVPDPSERPMIDGVHHDVGFGYDIINNAVLDIAIKDDFNSFIGDSEVSSGGITGVYYSRDKPDISTTLRSFYPTAGYLLTVRHQDGAYENKLKKILFTENPHAVFYYSRFSTGYGRQQILGGPDLTEEAILLAETDLKAFIDKYGVFYVHDNTYGVRGGFIVKLSFDASLYSKSDAAVALRHYCNENEGSISDKGNEILKKGHLEYLTLIDAPNYSPGNITTEKEFQIERSKLYEVITSDEDTYKQRFLDTRYKSYAYCFKNEELRTEFLKYSDSHMHWAQWSELKTKLMDISNIEMSEEIQNEFNEALELINENLEKSKNFEDHDNPNSRMFDDLIRRIKG